MLRGVNVPHAGTEWVAKIGGRVIPLPEHSHRREGRTRVGTVCIEAVVARRLLTCRKRAGLAPHRLIRVAFFRPIHRSGDRVACKRLEARVADMIFCESSPNCPSRLSASSRFVFPRFSTEGKLMDRREQLLPPDLEVAFYRLYRNFFDLAEKKRRWSVADDIPWRQINRSLDPAIADVVESFCAVELYLPDYLANAMSGFRTSRGKAWFYANWGYEESKHSLALGDWLLRSGMRSDEQMADLQDQVDRREWTLPHDSPVGMLIYAMVQELSTGMTYRNLRERVIERGDPALSKLLGLIGIDEQAHYHFFLQVVRVYLEYDRPGTLKQLRRVLHNFAMPAIYELVDGQKRVDAIAALQVFNYDLYFREVYQPILSALKVSRSELRQGSKDRLLVANSA